MMQPGCVRQPGCGVRVGRVSDGQVKPVASLPALTKLNLPALSVGKYAAGVPGAVAALGDVIAEVQVPAGDGAPVA